MTNALNLAVQVTAYVEEKGVVGVKGKRLDSQGEEVVVFLTNRGELASNTRRPPLSDFRDKKNNLGVEIGGVIGFDRCYPNGTEGKYFGGWPTYLAGDGGVEEMKRLKVNRSATLQVRSAATTGRLFGTLSVWQEANITELPTLQNLEAATAKWLNDVLARIPNAHGAAVMRARNAAGEVVAYTYVYARYDKEQNKYESGDTTMTNFRASRAYEGFAKETADNTAVKFDIVPAVNLDISPKALEEGGNALRMTEKAYQRDGELITKSTTFVMDPSHRFVIKVMVHDPFGDSGVDPVLLGKGGNHVTYNAAFKASLTGETPVPSSGQMPPPREPVDSSPAIQF